MSYRLRDAEPLVAGIRRIAAEQVGEVLEGLGDGSSRDAAIHEARKRFKRVRALLRLVRDALGEESFRRENRCYRDAGRELAAVRDAWVVLDTLVALREGGEAEEAGTAIEALEESLRARYEDVARSEFAGRDLLARVAETVRSARDRIDDWPLEGEGFDLLRHGLGRVYGQGRERLREALEEPSFEHFHEWRKRVKDLWHQIQILAPIESGAMEALANEIEVVSDLVGDANDCSELLRVIRREPGLVEAELEREALVRRIDRRRAGLRRRALSKGRRIWHEEETSFVDRVAAYWRVWRERHPYGDA